MTGKPLRTIEQTKGEVVFSHPWWANRCGAKGVVPRRRSGVLELMHINSDETLIFTNDSGASETVNLPEPYASIPFDVLRR